MNYKRFLIATVVLFAFIFLFEWFVHGFLLSDMYKQTSKVWRSIDEMEANFPLLMLFQLCFAAWLSFVFTRLYPEGGLLNGLRYGLYFGVFAGLLSGSWYLHLPISAALGWDWFTTSIVEGLGSGLLLGAIYQRD